MLSDGRWRVAVVQESGEEVSRGSNGGVQPDN